MRCMKTWNATNATRIQSNQGGNCALLNFEAKNIVTTKERKNKKN